MLGWAPDIKTLSIGRTTLASPGLAAFAAAATQLTALALDGNDFAACTRADLMLQECHALQVLKCTCLCVPTVYPEGIQTLCLDLHKASSIGLCMSQAGGLTDALMLRLASLRHLSDLTLHLGDTATLPTSGHVCALQRLTVSLDVAERREVDLSWLQAQPHQELRVHVSMAANADVQRAVSEQLQGMQLHDLGLAFWGPMELEYQQIWKPITVTGRVKLTLHRLGCYIQHVPTGPDLYIHADVERDEGLHVAWQPVAAAERVTIHAGDHNEIWLVRPGNAQDAFELDRPWQLTLYGPLAHPQLPPSQLPPSDDCEEGLYSWQNQAATSAGWILPTSSRDTTHIF